MATVTPVLRTSKRNADGHSPIWIRFSDSERTLYTSTGVYIHTRHWNQDKGKVRKGHKNYERINAGITQRLADAEEARLHLLAEGAPVTAEKLRKKWKCPSRSRGEASPQRRTGGFLRKRLAQLQMAQLRQQR